MQFLSRRTRHLLLQKFRDTSNIKDSRKFAVANFASIACALLLMHQINALPVNARSTRQNTIRYFIYLLADPLTSNTDKKVAPKATPPPFHLSNYTLESSNNEQAMLSTAVVFICGSDGSRRACRALLDCGSQANFVTKKFVEVLGLETRPSSLSICGVNGTVTNHVIRIKLQSRFNSYTAAIECIVTDRITGKIPTFSLGRDKFNFPRNIRLADPRFHISSNIDLLIVDLFWNLICVGQVKSSDKHPTLQKTRLGWILADHLDNTISTAARVHSLHASVTNAELHEHVSRAWQMDDISTQSHNYTMEENICECQFLDNMSQNSQGRYIVKLPVREQMLNNIDDSRESALKWLRGIERRFKRDPILKIQYAAFLDEYLSLGRTHATHGATHCGRNNIILSSTPLRLQNGWTNIENSCYIWCILPQQFRRIVKRRASSGIYRSTRFDLNFDALPFFHLCHHRWHHKNVSVNFNASISDAPAENSLAQQPFC